MRRREFVAGIGSAAAAVWSANAPAQPNSGKKVAVLMGSAPTKLGESYLAAFLRRLQELGWGQGRIQIDTRWWMGTPDAMRPVIAQMLASSPDVVMVFSNLALAVLKPMAGQVPIVFVGVGDPIGDGFVASLARPGGTITGFAGTDGPIGGKWLEVLKETVPSMSRAMLLMHPETPIHREFWRSAEAAAPQFGVEVVRGAVYDAAGIERAITSFSRGEGRGLIVAPHAITWANEQLIVALTLRHRLPAHFATAASVMAGGLVCYGHDFEDSFRKTAEYVDRILRGEKPADLPVQMPTKFRLVLNLKTARHVGVVIPSALLARADEVIE